MNDVREPRVGVIGCGYWGKNHVRTLHALGALAAVCDTTEGGRRVARELVPEVPVYESVRELLSSTACDGIVVATPAESHYELTSELLGRGYDVLVEKPLALHLREGERLVEMSERRRKILMVGHILEYHPAIVTLQALIKKGELGAVRYIYSSRLNLGKIRREENILWSFAPHDIAVSLRLAGDLPLEVTATGGAYIQPNVPDVTVTQMLFDNGVRGHIFVSWLHPYKEQKLVVIGSKKMAVFDDVAKSISLYDQRFEWQNNEPQLVKNGSTTIPFAAEEPLRVECRAFLDAIRTRVPPISDGSRALHVLHVLAACQRSLMLQGQPVQLPLNNGPKRGWFHDSSSQLVS